MIIESGPDFRYSQLGSLLGGHSVKEEEQKLGTRQARLLYVVIKS